MRSKGRGPVSGQLPLPGGTPKNLHTGQMGFHHHTEPNKLKNHEAQITKSWTFHQHCPVANRSISSADVFQYCLLSLCFPMMYFFSFQFSEILLCVKVSLLTKLIKKIIRSRLPESTAAPVIFLQRKLRAYKMTKMCAWVRGRESEWKSPITSWSMSALSVRRHSYSSIQQRI